MERRPNTQGIATMERRPNTQAIAWLVDLRLMEKLDLDPPYQRFSVWNDTFRRYFIDTILRGYPSPTIFLVKNYGSGLRETYGVVDGKQRITSIFQFLDGELQTQQSDDRPDISEKYFEELADPLKRKFYDYLLPVEVLSDWGETDLRQAFDRMNRNVAQLTSQELRHAKYSGVFINFCEDLAKDPFWDGTAVATERRVERMADIEFISEFACVNRKGNHRVHRKGGQGTLGASVLTLAA